MEHTDDVDAADLFRDPTGTGLTSSNDIIDIDAHVDLESAGVPPSKQPELTPDILATVADQLAELNADDLSARVEIERRHLVDDDEHILRFTAGTLTQIVTVLAIAYTRSKYADDFDATRWIRKDIKAFGRAVELSADNLLDAEFTDIEFPHLKPIEGERIDPYRVIVATQSLVFLDDDGEPITVDREERESVDNRAEYLEKY